MKKPLTAYLLALVALAPLGCSMVKKPVAATEPIAFVALLPVEVPTGVRKERVQLIQDAVRSELQNRGYLLLPAQAVRSKCPEPRCDDLPGLFERYGIEAVATLSLGSVDTNSFLLGRYDTITGSIRFTDRNGKELARGEHTERIADGLLINSGSIQQIAKTFTDTFRDDTFSPLAREFARGIAAALPPPPSGTEKSTSAPEILSSSVSSIAHGVRELCIAATPNSILRVKFDNHSADLRETTPGRFCTRYSLSGIAETRAVLVEARSFSGLLTTKMFSLNDGEFDCALKDLLEVRPVASRVQFELRCKNASSECSETLERCKKLDKLVFRGASSVGPFEKIGEFKGSLWSEPRKNDIAPSYSVALKIAGGIAPNPVTINTASSSAKESQ